MSIASHKYSISWAPEELVLIKLLSDLPGKNQVIPKDTPDLIKAYTPNPTLSILLHIHEAQLADRDRKRYG